MMKYLYSLLFVLVLISGCGKEENYVPDVVVNYNVTLTQFSLQAKNGILLVPNQGVAGLMIVRLPSGGFAALIVVVPLILKKNVLLCPMMEVLRPLILVQAQNSYCSMARRKKHRQRKILKFTTFPFKEIRY